MPLNDSNCKHDKSGHIARVKAVFRGGQPDRTPLCEQVIPCSVASEILGRKAYTGSSDLSYHVCLAKLRGAAAVEELRAQVFDDLVAVTRKLELDILLVNDSVGRVGVAQAIEQLDEYSFRLSDGENWSVCKFDPASHQFGTVRASWREPELEEVVTIMQNRIAQGPTRREELPYHYQRAIAECAGEFVIAGCSFMSIPMKPGWLEASLLEPELTADYLDLIVEENIAYMELQRQHGIWLFNGGGDFAYNTGPIYSPKFFGEVMAPRWKKMFDWCREHDAIYVFRSDGNLWPVADSLFGQARPQAYYEVDHDAGMTFDRLREAFPELVLVGNVSCDTLQRGTAEEVRKMTRYCLDSAAPRVIIASANSLLHGTPLENIYAMYDTAKEYRACQVG